MRGTSEEVFVRAFEACLYRTPAWADGVFFSEVDTGEGVPDLILVRIVGMTKHEVAQLLNTLPADPFLNGTGAVLAELHRRPHSLNYLAQHTGLTREYVRRAVYFLCRLGWATQTDRGLFVASCERVLPDFEITAFEFKMKDAGRAVQQAIRYRQFAHKAIVILPPQRQASVDAVSELAYKATLGIATFDATSCAVRFSIRPRTKSPRSRHAYMHVLGRLILHIEVGDHSSQRRFPKQSGAKGESARFGSSVQKGLPYGQCTYCR